MGNNKKGEITLAEYKRLDSELKASVQRELKVEAALHDCIKFSEKLDRMLKEAGL